MSLGYWIGFSKVSGIGPARLQSLLTYYGDIATAWRADLAELRAIGLDRRTVENFAKTRHDLDLTAEVDRLEKLNVMLLTWDSPDYPALLKTIPDPPITLYVRGSLAVTDDWAVAVVGTRKATSYGQEVAHILAKGLVENGITVVSGLAQGIDTAAHAAALEHQGRTLAILGCGVDVVYPSANAKLSQRIMASGALISEYPLGTKPEAMNFPRRNRIISGLSLGVVVVEGAVKSGAAITANCALEQGREVFAVPGPIFRSSSAGPNLLIQKGAKLVTQVQDILEELNLSMVPQQTEARSLIPENQTEALLLQQLTSDPMHIDDLGRATHLPAAEVSSTLVMMELKGMVRQVGSMNYVLAR
jgi:DNA processing protein